MATPVPPPLINRNSPRDAKYLSLVDESDDVVWAALDADPSLDEERFIEVKFWRKAELQLEV